MTPHARSARLVLAIALLAGAGSARAEGAAVVLGQSLALAGLVGGALGGAAAGLLAPGRVRLWPAFGVYLGGACMVASTWVGTLDVVPLTLALGGLFGALPFVLGFCLSRQLALRLQSARRAARSRWR